jgi:hypothetical protein
MAVVNLTSPYDQESAKIARSQKYAEMLQQQALQQPETFSYNGIQAPISTTAGLAKILQGLTGVYMQNQADEKTTALREKAQGEAGDIIGKMLSTERPGVAEIAGSAPAEMADVEDRDFMRDRGSQDPLALGAALKTPGGMGAAETPGTAATPARAKTTAERYADVLAGKSNPVTAPIADAMLAQLVKPKENPKFQSLGENDRPGTVDPLTGKWTASDTGTTQERPAYRGTGEGAQDYNILLQGDPSSAVYKAAYNRQATPKMALDQATNQIVYQQPDMSAFRPPVGSGAAPGATDARPAGISFAPIPGATPPSTEGERKAGTLLARLQNSQAQLNAALAESPGSERPPVGAAVLGSINPILGNVATSEGRQRVEAAQLDILDAALTLGTGAAYTREQLEGYRKSYFPQIGDEPKTVEDKAARLQGIIDAAKIAAGRSAPAVKPPPVPDQSSPPVQSLFEGRNTTFANGQVWTLRGGQAVRVK